MAMINLNKGNKTMTTQGTLTRTEPVLSGTDYLLFKDLQKIRHTVFPCEIDGMPYQNIQDYVNEITIPRNCRYTLQRSLNEKRHFVKFHCTFRTCDAQIVFTRKEKFYNTDEYTFNATYTDISDHTHSSTPRFFMAHRNTLIDEMYDKVRFQTRLGVLPGRIRSNL